MSALLPGDIVQITDEAHHWFPCIAVVSEIKSFGIQGFVFIPTNDGSGTGEAYIRLHEGAYEPLRGSAIILPESTAADRLEASLGAGQ